MGHTVGSMLLPVPVPATETESIGDPAIDLVAEFFETTLKHWLKDAWGSKAPGEPIIRTVIKHDPEETAFAAKDLPTLCLWRDEDDEPSKYTDTSHEVSGMLRILWVAPPTTQGRQGNRHPFFVSFKNCIYTAIHEERDPSWVKAGDESDEAAVYGTNIVRAAKFDRWDMISVKRVPVVVPSGATTQQFVGYLATLRIWETTSTDPEVYAVSPFQLDAQLTTVDDEDDPALERFRFVVP